MALKHIKEFTCDVDSCGNKEAFHRDAIVDLPKDWLRVTLTSRGVNRNFMVCASHAVTASDFVRGILH